MVLDHDHIARPALFDCRRAKVPWCNTTLCRPERDGDDTTRNAAATAGQARETKCNSPDLKPVKCIRKDTGVDLRQPRSPLGSRGAQGIRFRVGGTAHL